MLNKTEIVNLAYKSDTIYDFASRHITSIDTDTFIESDHLEHLDLSNNLLGFYCDSIYCSVLPEEVFRPLKKLAFLNLIRNFLTPNLLGNGKVFQGLVNLKKLYLGYNKITSINNLFLENLQSLNILDLTHNELKTLDISGFAYLKSLYYLGLDKNLLSSDTMRHLQTKVADQLKTIGKF